VWQSSAECAVSGVTHTGLENDGRVLPALKYALRLAQMVRTLP
jgi:hypothetical protein